MGTSGSGSDKQSDRQSEEQQDVRGRRLVERVLRDTVRRVVETGVEKIAEGPENLRNFVADLKLPKDIASHLLLQIEETKTGLYKVVAGEVRSFLERTNLSEQVADALASVTLEIKTEVRFIRTPAPGGAEARASVKPQVTTSVRFPPDPFLDDEDER